MAPVPSMPHAIIGTDFGTAYTKAAIRFPHAEVPKIYTVTFAGGPATPTAIQPSTTSTSACSGFQAMNNALKDDFVVYRNFKTQSPNHTSINPTNPVHSRAVLAKDLTSAFLGQLLPRLKEAYGTHCPVGSPAWEDESVQFFFSVPAAGDPKAATSHLSHAATQAGYTGHRNHTISEWSCTESEAAAAYSIKHGTSDGPLQVGSSVLVTDVGGGTSDLCLFNIGQEGSDAKPRMDLLEPVTGGEIGSVCIDNKFEALAMSHIAAAQDNLTNSLNIVAKMARRLAWGEEFQNRKHRFNRAQTGSIEVKFKAVDAKEGAVWPTQTKKDGNGIRIQGDKMLIDVDTMRRLFDEQLQKIQAQIDRQIEVMYVQDALRRPAEEQKSPRPNSLDHNLDVILLSGGLGSSAYVKEQLANRLETDRREGIHSNIDTLVLKSSRDPQFCVVEGMIHLAMQKLKADKAGLAGSNSAISKLTRFAGRLARKQRL